MSPGVRMELGKDGSKYGPTPKRYEVGGPLAGLWVRTANAFRNAGLDSRDKVHQAVLSGRLRPKGGMNRFGQIMYVETLTWLGLEPERVERLRDECAGLPPLSDRVTAFVAVDLPGPAAWPQDEAGYRFYVYGWNLAVLPPGSTLAGQITDEIAALPDELRLPVEQRVAELVWRKRAMFPDDPRVIGGCRPVLTAGEFRLRLTVTSQAGTGELGDE